MNGKELRVSEYNLTFGKSARMINVFGIFKYKANNNLYIINLYEFIYRNRY